MFSQRVEYPRDTPPIFQPAKFLVTFYDNTSCNKINQMDLYSLVSIHISASRVMLPECLMNLDHLSREVEL